MTDHQNAINPGARSSVGISLAPGPSSTACDDQLIGRRDYFEAVAGRISRNRDMWRGQCERQAAEIERLRAELEHRSAYWITHKGALLACSGSMRDAYSDEKVRADTAEVEIERLRGALNLALEYWADRQQRYKNRAPAWVEKARAALQSQDREDAPAYRLLGVGEIIQADDEFIANDGVTWSSDGTALWVGMPYTHSLKSARRRIEGEGE